MNKWIKKYWGTACLLGAVLLLFTSGTIAVYTNYSSTRRVVSVKADNSALFSSNLLFTEDKTIESNAYQSRKITLAGNSKFALEIYNYILGDTSTYNSNDITYTLCITLLSDTNAYGDYSVQSGEQTYTFQKSGNQYKTTIDGQTLAGNTLSKNSYVFQVPETEKNRVRFCVEAIPSDDSYIATNYKKLAAFIVIGDLTLEKNWAGHLLDMQNDRTPNQYDGFNYEISGNGKGAVTISWNSEVLLISPWFVTDTNGKYVTTEEGWEALEIQVGGENQPTAYQTQFYWAGARQNIDWQSLSEMIKVNFVEQTEN